MKNKILFVLCLLFGLMYINSGLNKFFNYIPVPKDMPIEMVKLNEAIMTIGWLLPLVAIVEIIGGVLFILPKTRALGAVVIFPIMIGILLTHVFNAPDNLPIAVVLLVINIGVIIENKNKYMPMIKA